MHLKLTASSPSPDSPYEIWVTLNSVHISRDIGMQLSIYQKLTALKQADNESMFNYITWTQHLFYLARRWDSSRSHRSPKSFTLQVVSKDLVVTQSMLGWIHLHAHA